MNTSVRILVLMFAMAGSSLAPGQVLRTIEYQSTNEDFANPERGFYRYRNLTVPANFNRVRQDNHSLIYGRITAINFRDKPFSQEFLDSIQTGFDQARLNGIKVKPRVLYNDGPNDGGGGDAPKSVILGHIEQLAPIFAANKDVIYLMDAGFIGLWGEWHGSQNGLDNNADRTEILSALLDAVPSDRMVGIRTPHYKREIFNGSPIDDSQKITRENAFDGSDLTRVGHLNDCFLSSSTDVGTYVYTHAGWSRDAEITYIGGESRYAPHGGETCARSAFSTGPNAIAEMEQLHTDYLNFDYNRDVLQDWRDDGSFDEISRRLGYRFELQSVELPQAIRPSGVARLNVEIDNVGFGELFNPRTVEVTLKNNATNEVQTAALSLDPRYWSGGSSNSIQALLSIPSDTPEGTYSVGMRMPDAAESLRDDVRYAIRFANENVWDAASGINVLTNDLEISQGADGPIYANLSAFAEISDLSELQETTDADFDRNGAADADDIDALATEIAVGGSQSLFDLNADGSVTQDDLADWLRVAGTQELGRAYQNGDANLDGTVDHSDFEIWSSHRFTQGARWSQGDFNADQVVDVTDFNIWNQSRSFAGASALVPEPELPTLLLPLAVVAACLRK